MSIFSRKPKARCPVTADDKSFIEANYQWLIHQFGSVRERPVIQPAKLRIPATDDVYRLGELLVDFCCKNMEIDPDLVDLGFYHHGNVEDHGAGHVTFEGGYSLGEYHHRSHLTGKYVVHLNLESLKKTDLAINVISHELSHAKLIGEFRISGHEEAQELTTDLAAIYFGFGVFQANSSFNRDTWADGNWQGWSMSKSGYLPLEMTCYALAVHTWLQGLAEPEWLPQLNREPRRIVEASLAFLFKTNDCTVTDE